MERPETCLSLRAEPSNSTCSARPFGGDCVAALAKTTYLHPAPYKSLRACKSAIISNIITPLSSVEPSTVPLGCEVQLVLKRYCGRLIPFLYKLSPLNLRNDTYRARVAAATAGSVASWA
nr:hypothetical protein [Tanacetum cinerariifolium]